LGVLVTGGAGYIGSHTVYELMKTTHRVVVYDNLSKGHHAAVPSDIPLIFGDIREEEKLAITIQAHNIDTVIHFAADSLVGESMLNPAKYYENNVVGTLTLLNALRKCGVDKFVLSSTAAVYGEPDVWPISEEMTTNPTNVYGRTKLIIEGMLADFSRAYGLKYVSLRYFNAAGAVAGGRIGEDHAPESHLIPLVLKTALGQREAIDIYGTDYPTPDGTCIRDYIHVTDLAQAHVLAVEHLQQGGESRIYNLGSEKGFSVREVIDRAKFVTGIDFPVQEKERRAGDPAILVASSERIRQELGWKPVHSELDTIIRSAWQWHKANPNGFGDRLD
jgi:UDP-glucose 4-epimerase